MTAWITQSHEGFARSKGGDISVKNSQMFCITHNRAEGNR